MINVSAVIENRGGFKMEIIRREKAKIKYATFNKLLEAANRDGFAVRSEIHELVEQFNSSNLEIENQFLDLLAHRGIEILDDIDLKNLALQRKKNSVERSDLLWMFEKYAFPLMSEQDASILRMRFGGCDECPNSLESVSRHFGINREYIEQLEKEMFQKLLAKYKYDDLVTAMLMEKQSK